MHFDVHLKKKLSIDSVFIFKLRFTVGCKSLFVKSKMFNAIYRLI